MAFRQKQNFIYIFVIVFLLASFGLGFFIGGKSKICRVCPPENFDFSLFWESYDLLSKNYVESGKISEDDVTYGAISGMVKSLQDPYTIFMEPDETKRFIDDTKGSFEGVGMEIGLREGNIKVIAPLEGTPAKEAGLMAGDIIARIDGTSTIDIGLEQAVEWIRGPEGTEVKLGVYRESWGEEKEIPIVRAKINIPSLDLSKIEGEEQIVHLKLYHFSEKAMYDFREAAFDIIEGGSKKIILDLRNNPGGYLEVAQDIAGWFLEKGEVVVIEDFGGKEENIVYKAEGNAKLSSYPVAVLINRGSASGSEILAGALRDNKGVKLVGETSFGKGSVQRLEKLSDGSSLKITIAKWLTPDGDHIAEKGLEPDVEIELTEEDFEKGNDPQLEKAVEIIKELE